MHDAFPFEVFFVCSMGPSFDLVLIRDVQADAIIGCFRFLGGYFLLLVTKKRFQGTVCGEYHVNFCPFTLVGMPGLPLMRTTQLFSCML